MALALEICTALLAAFGLVCLGWLIFGRLVLPVGAEGPRVRVLVYVYGDGEGLEQTVSGLLWLRRTGLWSGEICIEDEGLDGAGVLVAQRLCAQPGVSLHWSGKSLL